VLKGRIDCWWDYKNRETATERRWVKLVSAHKISGRACAYRQQILEMAGADCSILFVAQPQ
jgi:hypothetical protein